MASQTEEPMHRMRDKKNEFNDGRVRAVYTWKESVADWFKHSWYPQYSDEKVEARLLSHLPFFPESDGKRRASVINTDIGNGNYIHEVFIENLEPSPEPSTNNNSLEPCKEVVLIHG